MSEPIGLYPVKNPPTTDPTAAVKALSESAATPPPSTAISSAKSMSSKALTDKQREEKLKEQMKKAAGSGAANVDPEMDSVLKKQVMGQLDQNKGKPVADVANPVNIADSVVDAYGRILMDKGSKAPAGGEPKATGGGGVVKSPSIVPVAPVTPAVTLTPANTTPVAAAAPARTEPPGLSAGTQQAVKAAIDPGTTAKRFIDLLLSADVNLGDVLQILGKARLAFAGKEYKTRLEMRQEKQLAAAQQIAETAAQGETNVAEAAGKVAPTLEVAQGAAEIEAKKAKALADVDLYLSENKVPINAREYINKAMADSGGDVNTALKTLERDIEMVKQSNKSEAAKLIEVSQKTMYADILRAYAQVTNNAAGPAATVPFVKSLQPEQKPGTTPAKPLTGPVGENRVNGTVNSMLE